MSTENEAFSIICEANGFNEKDVISNPNKFDKVEVFMVPLHCIRAMNRFPSLKHLEIIEQGVKVLEGLNHCPLLEKLYLPDNNITQIKGLDSCKMLKELNISGNKIKNLNGLSNLTELNILFLCDNQIENLSGLENNVNLKRLWLSGNNISTIGIFLDNLQLVEEIHLAGNKIFSFNEIPNFSRLQSLKYLYLSDPHFGENPVCSLNNYRIFTIHQLSFLEILDAIRITEEAISSAESTFTKKRMYYNMKIKAISRNGVNITSKASEAKISNISHIQGQLDLYVKLRKIVSNELDKIDLQLAYRSNEVELDSLSVENLKAEYQRLSLLISEQCDSIDALNSTSEEFAKLIFSANNEILTYLNLELSSGGNIRLEEGKSGDLWVNSCFDLISSRFQPTDVFYTQHLSTVLKSSHSSLYNISELSKAFNIEIIENVSSILPIPLPTSLVRTTQVSRVYNKFLKNRFEAKLEELALSKDLELNSSKGTFPTKPPISSVSMLSLMDSITSKLKNGFEYLFYVPQAFQSSFTSILESGFDVAPEEVVQLTNVLSIADFARISALLKQTKPNGIAFRGQVLLVKAFLASSKVLETNCLNMPSKLIFPKDHLEYSSVCESNGKQKLWHVFDRTVILPEYLVEFEYYEPRGNIDNLEYIENMLPKEWIPSFDNSEIKTLRPLLIPFLWQQNKLASSILSKRNEKEVPSNFDKLIRINEDVLFYYGRLRASDTMLLNPDLKFSKITYLNLHGNGIKKIEGISELVNLTTLILSCNEIQKLEGLSDFKFLRRIELGFNLICRIEGLHGLKQVEHFEMNNNLLYRLEDVNILLKCLPNLTFLSLRGNAVCDAKSYRRVVLSRLLTLASFDYQSVNEKERLLASQIVTSVTEDLIFKHAVFAGSESAARAGSLHHSGIPPRADDRRRVELVPMVTPLISQSTAFNFPDGSGSPMVGKFENYLDTATPLSKSVSQVLEWMGRVIKVDLSHQNLRKLQNMENLTNLKVANFSDNELARIIGLEQLSNLEELNLEDNRLSKIEGLNKLKELQILHLGKNRLSRIEELQDCTKIVQLSIEMNQIRSLSGLSHLSSLMELYAGNNSITNMKEITHLRQLPKLIILDLSGNSICRDPDYRSYVVFHLKKLKMLDAALVTNEEITFATDRYSGRLTSEFIIDKIGTRNFEKLIELDLTNCRLRSSDGLDSSKFTLLKDLNLDNNQLVDLRCVNQIRTLIILRANQNRISEISSVDSLVTLPYLQVLQLANNKISSITLLRLNGLRELGVLYLQGNEITVVDGLDDLPKLRELVLDRNKIRKIDGASFAKLTSLKELRVEENGLKTLTNLQVCTNLHLLYVGNNRFSEFTELQYLFPISNLLELIMSGTPFARKPMYRPYVITKLTSLKYLDGREVTSEERERAELMFGDPNVNQTSSFVYAPLSQNISSTYATVGNSTTANSFNYVGSNMAAYANQNLALNQNNNSNLFQPAIQPSGPTSNPFQALLNYVNPSTVNAKIKGVEFLNDNPPFYLQRAPFDQSNSARSASSRKSFINESVITSNSNRANPVVVTNNRTQVQLNGLPHVSRRYSDTLPVSNAQSSNHFNAIYQFPPVQNSGIGTQNMNPVRKTPAPPVRLVTIDRQRPISGKNIAIVTNSSRNVVPVSNQLNAISASQLLHALAHSPKSNQIELLTNRNNSQTGKRAMF